jgi:hypothetical protein
VQLLLQHGATAGNVNAGVATDNQEFAGLTPLHLLACWCPAAAANSSCSFSSNTSAATGEDGMSAADRAGVSEQIAAATLLLEQPLGAVPAADAPHVNVHSVHLPGTPLVIAAETGAYEFAAWLISKGADMNMSGGWGSARPIDYAVCGAHTKVACLLLEHGAEVSMLWVCGFGSSRSSSSSSSINERMFISTVD